MHAEISSLGLFHSGNPGTIVYLDPTQRISVGLILFVVLLVLIGTSAYGAISISSRMKLEPVPDLDLLAHTPQSLIDLFPQQLDVPYLYAFARDRGKQFFQLSRESQAQLKISFMRKSKRGRYFVRTFRDISGTDDIKKLQEDFKRDSEAFWAKSPSSPPE